MKTEVRVVGADTASDAGIRRAAGLLRRGQLVALPTETVYGLAGNAADPEAIARIFAAKERPADNPLIVHLADVTGVETVCGRVPAELPALADAFWPGPLTLVIPARPAFRETVCRGLETVAVRVPDHPIARAVIRAAGLPLAAPSANRSGRPSPTTAAHVLADMDGRIPLILDGGPCRIGLESTVLDLSGPEPTVLRPGLLTVEMLEPVLGRRVRGPSEESAHRSPGTRYRHYSPDARVHLLAHDCPTGRVEVLVATLRAEPNNRLGYIGTRYPIAADEHLAVTPEDLPAVLYQSLREMDARGVTDLLIDGVAEEGAGLSLMDRLRRAATHLVEG